MSDLLVVLVYRSMIICIALERLACTAGGTLKYHKPCFGTHFGPILHISTAETEMEKCLNNNQVVAKLHCFHYNQPHCIANVQFDSN